MTRTLGIVLLILLFACQTSAADTPQSRDALSNDASSVRSSDADTRSSPTQGAQHTYDTRNTRATQTAAKLAPVSTAWSTFKSQGVSGIIARSELVTFVRFLLTTLHVDGELRLGGASCSPHHAQSTVYVQGTTCFDRLPYTRYTSRYCRSLATLPLSERFLSMADASGESVPRW
eukprot:6199713-Pleurochrysis_carterae.AAC.3